MKIPKSIFLFFFISFFLIFNIYISPSFAKDKKVSFDAQAAMSYIKDLAADSMLGRKSGEPGATMAEEYVATKFKKWGVGPGGVNGTYFQPLTIEYLNIEPGVVLEIIAEKSRRNLYFRDDYRVRRFSGSGHFTAEIVFVGYGIHAPGQGYDDFANINIKGKVALMVLEFPSALEKKFPDKIDINKRVKAVQDHGARAVLVCPSPVKGNRIVRGMYSKEAYNPDFVTISIQDHVAKFIFKDLKTELRYLVQEMDRTSKPLPYETGVKAFISVNALFDPKRPSQNVLGKITGSDKKLKDECIIIGAHLDHIGINPLGEVMNGANDNASGSAVAMEVARVLNLNRAALKRSVVFFLWAAEEQGYQGLPYYLDHPVHPLEKTVAYINMDMVGHGTGKIRFSGIPCRPDIWEILETKLPKHILDYLKPSSGCQRIYARRTTFPSNGVPRYGLSTDGHHFKYHQSRDDVDLIQPEIIKRTGDFMQAMVEALATEPSNLIPPGRQADAYLNHLTLTNFKMSTLSSVAEEHKDAKFSHIDLQLAIIEGRVGADENTPKVEIIKSIMNSADKIRRAKGLSFFSSPGQIYYAIREGKTTVMAGLRGIDAFRDDPRWIKILANQGIKFILFENPSFLFSNKGLNEEGKRIIESLSKSKIFALYKGIKPPQAKALLEHSKKPLILLEREVPGEDVLNSIKERNSALGLVIAKGEDVNLYFQKLDDAKKVVGPDHLVIVNDECFWGKNGKEQMYQLISKLLRAKYDRLDIIKIFSDTFQRILEDVSR